MAAVILRKIPFDALINDNARTRAILLDGACEAYNVVADGEWRGLQLTYFLEAELGMITTDDDKVLRTVSASCALDAYVVWVQSLIEIGHRAAFGSTPDYTNN